MKAKELKEQQKEENMKEEGEEGEEKKEEEVLPLSAGIAFSIAWVLATAYYFKYIEGWNYGYR